jgi:O-antigen/teichoic acid export membrane protein
MVLLPHYRTRMSSAKDVVPRRELMRVAGAVSSSVLAVTAVGSIVLLTLPDTFGRQLFGETWPLVVESLPGLLFWTAGTGVILGPLTILRATARTRQGVVARTVQSVGIVVCGFAGAALAGAPGAAWGVGTGAWIGVIAWYLVVWADGSWDPRTDAILGRDGADPDSPTALVTSG